MDTPTTSAPQTPKMRSQDLSFNTDTNLQSSSSPTTTAETVDSVSSPASKASLTSTSDSFLSDPFQPNSSPTSKTSVSDEEPDSMLFEPSTPNFTKSRSNNDKDTESEPEIVQVAQGVTTASAPSTPPPPPPSSLSSSSSPWSTPSSLSNISPSGAPSHSHSPQQPNFMTLPTSPSTSNANPTRLLLPRILTKPPFKPVLPEVISVLDSDLGNVPLPYIVNTLKRLGPRMMAALARTSASIPALNEPASSASANSTNENEKEKTVKSAMTLPRELVVTVSLESERDKGKSAHDSEGEKDNDVDFDTLPTHLLAVYSRTPKTGNTADGSPSITGNTSNQRRKVTLFPTHGIILAAHCACLPALPSGRKMTSMMTDGKGKKKKRDMKRHFGVDVPESIPESQSELNTIDEDEEELGSSGNQHGDEDKQEETVVSSSSGLDMNKKSASSHTQVTLPVVPLCIPSPGTFPILQAYLYTKRTDRLLAALVPAIPSFSSAMIEGLNHGYIGGSETSTLFASSPADLSRLLTMTFTPNILLAATLRTHELWANVVALGIFDDNLWNVINYSWKVLVGALEVVQMKMRIPARSVLPQVQAQVQTRPGSSARNVQPLVPIEQGPSSHVSQELPVSSHARTRTTTRSGDDQSGCVSPQTPPLLPSPPAECPPGTLEEDRKRDEEG